MLLLEGRMTNRTETEVSLASRRLAPLRSAPLRSASIRSAPRKFLSPLAYAANNSCAVMLFHCPRITLRLAVLRPTSFPKRRGVQVMPLFVFGWVQRLYGCCTALALSTGHGPRNRACKPLGGIVAVQIQPQTGGRLPYDSFKVDSFKVGSAKGGSANVGSAKVGCAKVGVAKVGTVKGSSAKVGFAKVGAHKDGSSKVGSAKVGHKKVGSAKVGFAKVGFAKVGFAKVDSFKFGSSKVPFTCGVCR